MVRPMQPDFVFIHFPSVTSMLSTLNLSPLQQQREKAKLIMMHKIVNDLVVSINL